MRDYKEEVIKRIAFIQNLLETSGAEGIVYGNSGGKEFGMRCKEIPRVISSHAEPGQIDSFGIGMLIQYDTVDEVFQSNNVPPAIGGTLRR